MPLSLKYKNEFKYFRLMRCYNTIIISSYFQAHLTVACNIWLPFFHLVISLGPYFMFSTVFVLTIHLSMNSLKTYHSFMLFRDWYALVRLSRSPQLIRFCFIKLYINRYILLYILIISIKIRLIRIYVLYLHKSLIGVILTYVSKKTS